MYFYQKILCFIIALALVTFATVVVFYDHLSVESPPGFPEPVLNFRNEQDIQVKDGLNHHSSANQEVKRNYLDLIESPFLTSESESQKERLERIQQFCRQYHLGRYTWPNDTNDLGIKDPITPLYSYFYHDRKHKLAWCPVYKAGSTTWLYNMMLLRGYSEEFLNHPPKQLSILAKEVIPEGEPNEQFQEAFKLLVVRHPFLRLLSAYVDKLANASIGQEHGSLHFYKQYGRKIVSKFRHDPEVPQKEPTFEEFVQYLIDTDLVHYSDDHWLPAYLSCTPCRVSYDFVAKVETYTKDQQLLIDQTNLSHVIKPRWQHAGMTHLGDLLGKAKLYFSTLKRAQVEQLYKKYMLDFQIFGYSHRQFLEFAIPE